MPALLIQRAYHRCNTWLVLGFTRFLLTLLSIVSACDSASAAPRVAVLPIEGRGLSVEITSTLEAALCRTLSATGDFEAVTDADFRTMIDFEMRDLGQFCEGEGCNMDLARAVSVDYLLRSRVEVFGEGYSLELSLIGTTKGGVLAREHGLITGDPVGMLNGTASLMGKLVEQVTVAPGSLGQHTKRTRTVMRLNSPGPSRHDTILSAVLGVSGVATVVWGVSMHGAARQMDSGDDGQRSKVLGGTLMATGSGMILGALLKYGLDRYDAARSTAHP